MDKVDPKLIYLLIAVIFFAVLVKLINPNKKYSTRGFWENASVASVVEVPEKALLPGNKNGPVVMWAAIATSDPAVIQALVDRGADVNESDVVFQGTPLTAAATYNTNPEIINVLVENGAEISKRVLLEQDALMMAAQFNKNESIVRALLNNGANPNNKSISGATALDFAKKYQNKSAISVLENY